MTKYRLSNNGFFVLEGMDEVGKTTLAKRICKDFNLRYTSEPFCTALRAKADKERVEAFEFHEDRLVHVGAVLQPAIFCREAVLCDRYFPSTCVYNYDDPIFGIQDTMHKYINDNYNLIPIPTHMCFVIRPMLFPVEYKRLLQEGYMKIFNYLQKDDRFNVDIIFEDNYDNLYEQYKNIIKRYLCFGN